MPSPPRPVLVAFRALPLASRLYVPSLVLVWIVAVLRLPGGSVPITAGLILSFALTGLVGTIVRPTGGRSVPNLVLILTCTVLWAPKDVLIGVGAGVMLGFLFHGMEPWRAVMNGCLQALPAAVAASLARALVPLSFWGFEAVTTAAIAAMVVYRVLNEGLLALHLRFFLRRPFLRSWGDGALRNIPSQLLSTPVPILAPFVVARLGGSAAAGLGVTAAAAALIPLARQELASYAEAQRTYEELVGAITQALDLGAPGTRGHTDRVVALALSAGRHLRVRPRHLESLRMAARLHDIGVLPAMRGLNAPLDQLDAVGRILATFPDRSVVDIVRCHYRLLAATNGQALPVSSRTTLIAAYLLTAAHLYDAAAQHPRRDSSISPEQTLATHPSLQNPAAGRAVAAVCAAARTLAAGAPSGTPSPEAARG